MASPDPALDPDLLDAFEGRAALREADGGQALEEAETAALAEVAETAGISPDDLRGRLDHVRGAPPLDPGGLPFTPCGVCLGQNF